MSVPLSGLVVDSGGVLRPVKRAFFDGVSIVGSQVIVPAVAGLKIRVLAYELIVVSFVATAAFFSSGGVPTKIGGICNYQGAVSRSVFSYSDQGCFETAPGEALNITTSAAGGNVGITFVYIETT